MSVEVQDRVPTLRQVLERSDDQLCHALKQLDDIERGLANAELFEFTSALPADTADLAASYSPILRQNGIAGQIQTKLAAEAPEVLAAHVYSVGGTANLIHAFRWTRKKAIAECLGSLTYSLQQNSLLPALVLTRTILEHVGTSALFRGDALRITRADESPEAGGDWVLEVLNALVPRLKGSRIDWADYLDRGLKGKRRKGYQMKEGHFDLTAKDLLKGIDLVDKSVPGVRNAYEFLSEYAHPNYGSYQLGFMSVTVARHRHGFRMIRKVYGVDTAPWMSVSEITPLLRDVWELLVAAIHYFLTLDEKHAELEHEVGKRTRSWLRHLSRRQLWGSLFQSADLCPCLSGKVVVGCCGRLGRTA